jgi:porin
VLLEKNIKPYRGCVVTVLFLLVGTVCIMPALAQDDAEPSRHSTDSVPARVEAAQRSLRCQTPANPHKLHPECIGTPFDTIEETLTKDWAGYRTELMKLGITPLHSYTAQFMGNPSGGQRQGFTYAGTLEALFAWDLHKLLRIPGLSFNVGASYSSGRNLSENYVGNVFPVQSAFTGSGNVNLQVMYLQQLFFDGVLGLAVGRLAPANTFATLPVLGNYVNGGINPVPGALGINDQTFTASPPGVEWGAQVLYKVTPTIQVAAGIFNTNPYAAAGNDNGLDFTLQQGNTGVLAVAQLSYLENQLHGDTGLPGEYTIGGFYDSNSFSSLSVPAESMGGNYSLYAMFQQMVWRDGGPGTRRGMTAWAEAALSPKPSVSSMPYFLGGGLSFQGLIPCRSSDIVSMGVTYGSFSADIPHSSSEMVIEADYAVALTPWLVITPDIQYVINPSGSSNVRNALVLGAQLAVTF